MKMLVVLDVLGNFSDRRKFEQLFFVEFYPEAFFDVIDQAYFAERIHRNVEHQMMIGQNIHVDLAFDKRLDCTVFCRVGFIGANLLILFLFEQFDEFETLKL